MPALDADVVSAVAVAAAGAAVLALVLALVVALRLRSLRRSLLVLRGDAGEGDVLEVTFRQTEQVRQLRDQVERQAADLAGARADLAASLRHVGLVRYDAFGDMGGQMSFSAAVLDDAGDGLVLTAIHGRSDSRTYAKGVVGGASEHALSPEELQAVGDARKAAAR